VTTDGKRQHPDSTLKMADVIKHENRFFQLPPYHLITMDHEILQRVFVDYKGKDSRFKALTHEPYATLTPRAISTQ